MVKPNSSKSFDERCYDLLLKIPEGKVTTYKEMAEALGCQGYRAVGGAMNRNPKLVMIPCHRVVKSNGYLGGYASGTSRKLRVTETRGS
jgi:methylated-DNA-[protein]-cysteine S-methyltransferase